jgi:RNA recognition motif. (a.k.a. RRM, RBD, or RNP domain)
MTKTTRLYVGGLSFNTTEDEVRQLFSQIGELRSCRLVRDRDSKQSRGFAFVEMARSGGATSNLAVSGAYGRSFEPTAEASIIGVHSNRAAPFRFSDSRRAISLTLTSIWKHFGDRRPVGCGSAFVRQELLLRGFSCSRRPC